MPEQTSVPNPAAKKMKPENKALMAFVIAGILVGIASWAIGKALIGTGNPNAGPWAALALAVVVLVLIPQALGKIWKISEKFKWWLTNGGWMYVFFWFIVWIIFYNLW